MTTVAAWKQHIRNLERQSGGQRHFKERRCLNRYMKGGSASTEYVMLMDALRAGGWRDWLPSMNIFKTSESIVLMRKVQKELKSFCDELENNKKSFPLKKLRKVLKTSKQLGESEDMKAIRENPEETEKMIKELEIKENESRSSFLARAAKWAWQHKGKITTALFAAYMIWCRFRGGTGCEWVRAIVGKGSTHIESNNVPDKSTNKITKFLKNKIKYKNIHKKWLKDMEAAKKEFIEKDPEFMGKNSGKHQGSWKRPGQVLQEHPKNRDRSDIRQNWNAGFLNTLGLDSVFGGRQTEHDLSLESGGSRTSHFFLSLLNAFLEEQPREYIRTEKYYRRWLRLEFRSPHDNKPILKHVARLMKKRQKKKKGCTK